MRPWEKRPRPGGHRLYPWLLLLIALSCIPVSIVAFIMSDEDLFITLRYARNFLDGHGLVFNRLIPEERVEGYSNLLWLLMISAVNAVLRGNMDIEARALSIGVYVVLIVVSGYSLRGAIAKSCRSAALMVRLFLPVALLLQPLLHHVNDKGLEALFVSLLLFGGVLFVARRRYAAASVCMALAAATRPEGFAYWFVLLPLVAFDALRPGIRRRGRRRAACLAYYTLPWLAATALLTAWRMHYYGLPLPNTVYAKMGNWNAGILSLSRLWDFYWMFSALPVVALAGVAAAWFGMRHARRYWREMAAAALMFAGVSCFGLSVGRSYERMRYLAPIIPPVLFLLQIVLAAAVNPRRRRTSTALTAITVLLLAANFFQPKTYGPQSLRFHVRLMEFALRRDWDHRVQWFAHPPVYVHADVGQWLDKTLPPDAIVGSDQVGTLAYYMDRTVIDLMGLCDTTTWKVLHKPALMADYLIGRGMTHAVICVALPSGKAGIPPLDGLVRMPAFASQYRLTHMLKARAGGVWGFALYTKNAPADAATTEVLVGKTADELRPICPF